MKQSKCYKPKKEHNFILKKYKRITSLSIGTMFEPSLLIKFVQPETYFEYIEKVYCWNKPQD